MERNTFPEMVADGFGIKSFNERLGQLLKPLVFESENQNEIATYFSRNNNKASVGQWLSLPGKWLHYPLYFPLKKLTLKVLPDVDFYDSMLIGSLTFLYPLYLCLIAWIVFLIAGGWYWVLVFPLLPFLAWIYVKMKR